MNHFSPIDIGESISTFVNTRWKLNGVRPRVLRIPYISSHESLFHSFELNIDESSKPQADRNCFYPPLVISKDQVLVLRHFVTPSI